MSKHGNAHLGFLNNPILTKPSSSSQCKTNLKPEFHLDIPLITFSWSDPPYYSKPADPEKHRVYYYYCIQLQFFIACLYIYIFILFIYQRKFSVQNFRVTDIQQLFNHHSSYTTHHPPLITHQSSYTTHHTPLIIHYSSHTTHHTLLIIHHSSHTTHLTPRITHHGSHTTYHTLLIIHHSSYTTHHTPLIHQLWFQQLKLQATPAPGAQYKMRCGEIANARNAVFFNGTGGSEAGKSRSAERRARDRLGSFSDHARNRPSIGIRVFTCFLK